jgi:hypothetical protein
MAMALAREVEPALEGPKRGVSPEILLEQVRNTAAFALAPDFSPGVPYLEVMRRTGPGPLGHVEYYRLCLSAHFTTVATYVPTDVDNQIRFKLWDPTLPIETILEMAEVVKEAHGWDTRPVSRRWVRAPRSGELLGGHMGEWFSVAAGAYGATRKRAPDAAAEVAGLIIREVERHAEVFQDFKQAKDGIGLLKTATLIAHNLGDLDRVLEMWNVPASDPLMEAVFKAGHGESMAGGAATDAGLRARKALAEAGALNKAHMAHENHRHFALRAIRALRRSPDLLVPIGPFFDDWGRTIARHPAVTTSEVAEVVSELVLAWERLGKAAAEKAAKAAAVIAKGGTPAAGSAAPAPMGYARALAGILDAFPGGMSALSKFVPARVERDLKAGPLRVLLSVPQSRFEENLARAALKN